MGYDAGKQVKGRKIHALVDSKGLPMRVVVHSAAIQDPWQRRGCAESGHPSDRGQTQGFDLSQSLMQQRRAGAFASQRNWQENRYRKQWAIGTAKRDPLTIGRVRRCATSPCHRQ